MFRRILSAAILLLVGVCCADAGMALPESYRSSDLSIRPLGEIFPPAEETRFRPETVTLSAEPQVRPAIVESGPESLTAVPGPPANGFSGTAAFVMLQPYPRNQSLLWRVREANAGLPPCPLLEGLLKPG